ncbi:alkylated DNA repair protein (DNA oxidative demethylase) [Angulomicrobium tetraedrale]|uniref:Alkylated DNA repair protein (DNA oxidative demethylase) n=1 Tax=Ancylobacter tetraedralis TaxID=217068 RepID=A0A839Z4N1_9HYPH|nr:alpha-ketoglutarate-dependent dioxygenase AlkB [Ancylobacter tetraedralis]MBB3770592.1 alkylated DNA repair protein (DNA oxidative demethylase) [Ancylobacter tetraedralis]
MSAAPVEIAPGCLWWPGWLDRAGQETLAQEVREVLARAPLFTPLMPRTGKPFSVRMSNCGPLGWVSDVAGYRYQPAHPETGAPWPPFPDLLVRAWAALAATPLAPQACLINWYAPGARMGLHQDRDEAEFAAPVLSLSLGDTALFRIGGTARTDPTRSIRLASGDALLLAGPSRLAFHGIDRILPESSTLLRQPGRINLTLRRVHPADHGEIPPSCA